MPATLAKLTKYSHHFTVSNITKTSIIMHCDQFHNRFAQWGMVKVRGRYKREIIKHFSISSRGIYRFHIRAWNAFCQYLNSCGYPKECFEIVSVPYFEGTDADLTFGPTYPERPNQVAVGEYLLRTDINAKLVTAQAGDGKSYMAGLHMTRMKKRVMMIIRPMFKDKWVADLMKYCSIPKDRILVLDDGKQMQKFLAKCDPATMPYDAVVISNKVLQRWLSKYSSDGDHTLKHGFAIRPMELCERLGCERFYVDEKHMDFHLQFLIELYLHCKETIGLTATFMSDDTFLTSMMGVMHPLAQRATTGAFRPHAHSVSVHWWLQDPDNVRTMQPGGNAYSHAALEDSIMRNKRVKFNYFEMLRFLIEEYSTRDDCIPGDKILLFFFTKVMTRDFQKFIAPIYSHLVVNTFLEEDPEANLNNCDMLLSTVLSAGTARDIDQLYLVIMTLALSETRSNLQAYGRIRELKDGRKGWFLYLVCESIPKHLDYHVDKQQMFKERKVMTYNVAYKHKV